MRTPGLAALAALMVLASCGGLRGASLNPFTWFDRSSTEVASLVPEGGFPGVQDNRPLVAQVTDMAVEPVEGGAIVRAVGLPPTQGWWDAELVSDTDFRAEDGELRLRFVTAVPRQQRPAGPQRSREITAGVFVSDFRLAGVRRITVTGAENARTVTRR